MLHSHADHLVYNLTEKILLSTVIILKGFVTP